MNFGKYLNGMPRAPARSEPMMIALFNPRTFNHDLAFASRNSKQARTGRSFIGTVLGVLAGLSGLCAGQTLHAQPEERLFRRLDLIDVVVVQDERAADLVQPPVMSD